MKLFKEPLLHFLLIGAALFGAYTWMNRGAPSETETLQVRISEGEVMWLKETWAKQWQREPTRDEFRALVADFLKEELLAREAREMGLDQNDTYVRRRLAQKVEFLVQDASRLIEPSEDDLRKFHAAHQELFRDEARVSFTQIYFSREHRDDMAAARARLESNADPKALGDRIMLEAEYSDASPQTVAAVFGGDFAAALFALPPGGWHGPIGSGFGLHLVRLADKKPPRQLAFAEVRAQVAERWRDQRQRETNEAYFVSLLKKYDIVVDESVKAVVGVLEEKEFIR
jgi:parvulin-like peptidyl-prolyl isomerase